jgi:hypothetical protein
MRIGATVPQEEVMKLLSGFLANSKCILAKSNKIPKALCPTVGYPYFDEIA